MTALQGYDIKFLHYSGKGSILKKYANIGLGLGVSVVTELVQQLPHIDYSNYLTLIDNFFTSP